MVVTRDSDSTSSNITSDGTVKGLLNSTALSTFCSGTTGRATQLGNQIGLANFISGGAAVPIIYQSGAIENLNGIPAPKFNGTSNFYAMAGSSGNWPGTTVYFNAVFQVDDLLADYYIFGSDVSGGLALKIAATTGIPTLCTNTGTLIGQPFASIAAGSVYEIGVRHTAGATWSMQLNGSAAGSGTTAVSATAGNILLGQAGPTATGFFKGHIPDAMVTSSMANSPQYSIENGLALFYATLGTVTKIHNTVVSDTFTDTNGTDLASHTMNVGTGWTDLSGTHFIQSNAAQPNTLVSGKAFATFIPLSAGATGSPISDGVYTLSMTPTGILNNEFLPGMVLRISNTTNYLIFQLDGVAGTARLSSVVAGVSTSLGVSTVTIVAGTSYSCVITLFGPNITFAVNAETPIAVVSSVNQTIAKFGIRSSEIGTASACVFDTLTFTT
jgi:hypothetical protein